MGSGHFSIPSCPFASVRFPFDSSCPSFSPDSTCCIETTQRPRIPVKGSAYMPSSCPHTQAPSSEYIDRCNAASRLRHVTRAMCQRPNARRPWTLSMAWPALDPTSFLHYCSSPSAEAMIPLPRHFSAPASHNAQPSPTPLPAPTLALGSGIHYDFSCAALGADGDDDVPLPTCWTQRAGI